MLLSGDGQDWTGSTTLMDIMRIRIRNMAKTQQWSYYKRRYRTRKAATNFTQVLPGGAHTDRSSSSWTTGSGGTQQTRFRLKGPATGFHLPTVVVACKMRQVLPPNKICSASRLITFNTHGRVSKINNMGLHDYLMDQ